jgi:protein-disulfide isomerase
MTSEWKTALIGGFGGAVVALVAVSAAAWLGLWPGRAGDAAFHDYLMSHPQIVVEMTNKAQAEQNDADDTARQHAVDRLGMKTFFDPKLAFVTGPANAKTTFVEFFDYNCQYCRASIPALKKFYAMHKSDTRFSFIEFPFHGPNSTLAAEAAIAARKQGDKYVAFYFAMMSEDDAVDGHVIMADAQKAGLDLNKLQSDMKAPDVGFAIAAAHRLADAAKIDGTPAFIINSKVREGAVDDAMLDRLVKG